MELETAGTWHCPRCLVHLPRAFAWCPHCAAPRPGAPGTANPRKVGEVRRPVGLLQSLRTALPPDLGLAPGPPGRILWRTGDGRLSLVDLEGREEAALEGVEASDAAWIDGRALVVDRPSGRILSWDGRGAPHPWLQGLRRPFGLAAHPEGGVTVSCDAHLETFAADGSARARFGEDVPHRTFTAPANRGCAWAPWGLLYVADEAFGLVKVFHPDGRLARFLGGPPFERLRHTVMGYLDQEHHQRFDRPRAVAADSAGRIFVGEAGQDAVLVYSCVDRFLGRCTVPAPGGLYSDGAMLRVASVAENALFTFALD